MIRATQRSVYHYPSAAGFDQTIQRTFAEAAANAPDLPYVVDEGTRFTLGELAGRAGGLQQRLRNAGVTAGDVVTLQLPNWWEAIAAMHAVWGLGAIVNPVTPIYRGAELRAILGTSRPKVVIGPSFC